MSEQFREKRDRRERQERKHGEEGQTPGSDADYRSDVRAPAELEEPYAAGSALTELFGDHPEVKLVASILSEPDELLDKSELAQLAGVSRKSVHEHIDTLVDLGVAHEADSVGQITLYELPDTPVVALLHEIEEHLIGIKRAREGEELPEEWQSDDSDRGDTDRADGSELVEPYAEETPLPLLFGDHPEPKLVAGLISELDTRLNVTDISRVAGVGRTTVYGHMERFHTFALLKEAGKVGNSPHYEVVDENPLIDLLRNLELAIIEAKRTQEDDSS